MSEVPSAKVQAKAAEYLLKGLVKVTYLDPAGPLFRGEVRSASDPEGDPYRVRYNENGWHCDCLARVQVCAHVLACQTITHFQNPENVTPTLATKTDPDLDALLEGL